MSEIIAEFENRHMVVKVTQDAEKLHKEVERAIVSYLTD